MHTLRVIAALGGILRIYSFAALVPFVASFVWDEGVAELPLPLVDASVRLTSLVFGLFFLLVLLTGSALRFFGDADFDHLGARDGFLIVGYGWLLLAVLGAIPFLVSGAIRSPIDALFESMGGITTTGATVMAFPLEQHAASVLLWRAVLQYLGGIGIVILSVSIIARLTEGADRVLALETPGGTITRLQPTIVKTARALSGVYGAISLFIFAAYLLRLRYGPYAADWSKAVYDALAHTFTTIPTGGYSPYTRSVAHFDDPVLLVMITVFMLVGGGSFALYWTVVHGRPSRLWRNGEFRFFLLIYAAGFLVVLFGLLIDGWFWRDGLIHGAFQTAAFMTGTGYTSVPHDALHGVARMMLFVLMFCGGMVGSTTGGIKTFRLFVLMRMVRREVQRLLHPHAVAIVKSQGRILPEESLRRIVVFFFTYVTVFIAGTIIYTQMGLDIVSGISASAAALGNVGPAFGSVAEGFHTVPPAGKLVAVVQMWLGRLEIFTVLLLFTPGTYRD